MLTVGEDFLLHSTSAHVGSVSAMSIATSCNPKPFLTHSAASQVLKQSLNTDINSMGERTLNGDRWGGPEHDGSDAAELQMKGPR